MTSAVFAFFHHLCAFTLTAYLIFEFIVYRRELTFAEARRIQHVDLAYGISAGLLLVFGLSRVFFFEKGVNFYVHSPFFWVKMVAFAIVGILSIDPTVRYIRWNNTIRENVAPEISEDVYKRTRVLLWLEMIGIVVILLAAPMMPRGVRY